MRALEQHLGRIRNAGSGLLHYSMWDDHGREHATEEYAREMEALRDESVSAREAGLAGLKALVPVVRAEAPDELAAWADAHTAYLTAFIADAEAETARDETDNSTAIYVAKQELDQWREVHAGTRDIVDENAFYVSMNRERYRQLFGIDPSTLEIVDGTSAASSPTTGSSTTTGSSSADAAERQPAMRPALAANAPIAPKPWQLTFEPPQGTTIDALMSALANVTRGPVARLIDPPVGNPRDLFFQSAWVKSGPIVLTCRLSLATETDSNPFMDSLTATLEPPSATFVEKHALYHALRDELAKHGCTDITLSGPTDVIVDEAAATGDTGLVGELRAAITMALQTKARASTSRWVELASTRPDNLEAVLASYDKTDSIERIDLSNCELERLPSQLCLYPKLQELFLDDNPLDMRALFSVTFDRLVELRMARTRVEQVFIEHLSKFPHITVVDLRGTPLSSIDPAIAEACPTLRRILIAGTPLERDEAKLAVLRERCKNVTWS